MSSLDYYKQQIVGSPGGSSGKSLSISELARLSDEDVLKSLHEFNILQMPQSDPVFNQFIANNMTPEWESRLQDNPPFHYNLTAPYGLLSKFSFQAVEQIMQKRSASELIGPPRMLLEFEQNEYIVPVVEMASNFTIYSDIAKPDAADISIGFESATQLRYFTKIRVGDLGKGQLAKCGIDSYFYQLQTIIANHSGIFNRIAFFGIANQYNQQALYGLLNHPMLTTAVNGPASVANMTFDKAIETLNKGYDLLIKQTGGNITPYSDVTVGVPGDLWVALMNKLTPLGIPVLSTLQQTFPNSKFVLCPELTKADSGQSVMYFIANDTSFGGPVPTAVTGYSRMIYLNDMQRKDCTYEQIVISSTLGTIIFKPLMIARVKIPN